MRDISEKIKTLRIATAKATLHVSSKTLELIENRQIPKGNPFEIAKVAAIQAAKNCSQIIPYCHPLPIDFVGVEFEMAENTIHVVTTIKAIYKTGVEMEALTAASVAALTLYDMLKMLDETMSIGDIILVQKRGGKTDFREKVVTPLKTAVLVLSDSVAAGLKEDKSGQLIRERLLQENLEVVEYDIIPDDLGQIDKKLKHYTDILKLDLILTTGGTGLSPRDNTPEAMANIIEREAPGISEMLRSYGQERIPYAMLSRGKAGIRGRSLIINLPGSRNGVKECLDALFPSIIHAFKILRGASHPHPLPAQSFIDKSLESPPHDSI